MKLEQSARKLEKLAKMKIVIGVLTKTKKRGRGNEVINNCIRLLHGVNKHERAKWELHGNLQKIQKNIKGRKVINDRLITDILLLNIYVKLRTHARVFVCVCCIRPSLRNSWLVNSHDAGIDCKCFLKI